MPRAGSKGTKVVIAGAGIAGMTAALYLLDAGFDVTILEKTDEVGGKFGVQRGTNNSKHEHAYHFLGDWCANLWAVAEKIGLDHRHVQTSRGVSFLRPRSAAPGESLVSRLSTLRLEELGTLFSENLYSGVIPPDDMMIWFYSLLELLSYGRNLDENEFLNRISVNGFMRSLPYMTDQAALLHQEALMKAFSIPSYDTSVRSYRQFARFFSRDQDGRILTKRVDLGFWPLFQAAVEKRGGKLMLDTSLLEVLVTRADSHRKVSAIVVKRKGVVQRWQPVDHLLVTIPCLDVADLTQRSRSLLQAAPGLLELRKLKSKQMASLDLYFRKPLKGIPREHVTLIDDSEFRKAPRKEGTRRSTAQRKRLLATSGNRIASRFALSFIDNYQAWHRGQANQTWLNVVAADFEELAGLSEDAARDAMLRELGNYVDLDEGELDKDRTNLRLNADVPLFTNTVGSWQYRPAPGLYTDSVSFAQFDNFSLAGDYCRTDVDVVCLEGAMLAARTAAHAIAEKAGRSKKVLQAIEGLKPAEVSDEQVERLKRDLEPWLQLAIRRGFGASSQVQHQSEWRRVVYGALNAS